MNLDKILEKAKELSNKGEYEEAIKFLEASLKEHPESEETRQLLISILLSYGGELNDDYNSEFQKAEAIFNKVLEIDPKNYRALYNLGITHFNRRNNEKAMELYQKALQLNPTYKYCYYNMGLIHETDNQFEKALECYEKALSIDENFVYAAQAKQDIRNLLDSIKREQSRLNVANIEKTLLENKKLDKEQLKSLLAVSRSVRIQLIEEFLHLSKKDTLNMLIEWCKKYDLELDGDFLIINKNSLELLLKELDNDT